MVKSNKILHGPITEIAPIEILYVNTLIYLIHKQCHTVHEQNI